jgi:predicted aminopeptidase
MHIIRIVALVGIVALLNGCYYLQAAQGQLSLLAHRKPITRVIADPATSADIKTRLEYAQEAREFASLVLGLPDNKRDSVLWNVFAAPEFSVDPKLWCFPVAGCVVYRGYFKESAAQHYAEKLRAQGFDVAVAGVPAYSTLGHFNDPVISTMMRWNNTQVAATLFHELAHQVVYVKDDSAFNEAFATVVADEGIKRWLTRRNNPGALERWHLYEQRGNEFAGLLLRTRAKLRHVYAISETVNEKLQRKQQVLNELRDEYAQLKLTWDGYAGYDQWIARPLNNADFISIATYQQCVPGFEKLLHSVNDDLPRFYAAVKALAREPQSVRQHLCE